MMTLYCIPVGEFLKERFDFLKEVSKMETMISTAGQPKNLADVYPPLVSFNKQSEGNTSQETDADRIKLYDIVYAYISVDWKSVV